MTKNILLTAALFSFIISPAAAQSFHAEFSYQSFRPFINFRIELGNQYHYQRNPYETAYLKGYMDGVNQTYYADYRFYDMVYDIRAYEEGYRDGLRDRQMLLRLRGNRRFARPYFAYRDYYSPYYSVQIWLNELSFTFIKVPARRLPKHWARYMAPRVKQFRARIHHRHAYYTRFERQYKNYDKRLRTRARYSQNRYRSQIQAKDTQRRGPAKLNRKRARQRVENTRNRKNGILAPYNRSADVQRRRPRRTAGSRFGRSRRIQQRSRSTSNRTVGRRRVQQSAPKQNGSVRSRVKTRNAERSRGNARVKQSKNNKKEKNVRSRSRGKQKKVKRSRNRGSKARKVRSRSKSKSKSRGKVKKSRSRKSKAKKKRGGNRRKRGN